MHPRLQKYTRPIIFHHLRVILTKTCITVCARLSETAPVNSVNAHNEGLNVRVGGAAELAAGLSAERRAVTQREMVQRADSGAMSHHCGKEQENTHTHTKKIKYASDWRFEISSSIKVGTQESQHCFQVYLHSSIF